MFQLIVAVLLTIATTTGDQRQSQKHSNIITALLKDHNVTENFFASPLSIDVTLSLLAAIGNNGSDLPRELLPDFARDLYGDEFLVRNSFFVDFRYPNYEHMQTMVKRLANTESQLMNFQDAARSANVINAWASKNSKGKIDNLISAENINSLIDMLLVNIVYFKSDWNYKFNKNETKREAFYLTDGNRVMADMMTIKTKLKYYRFAELSCDIVMVPYKNAKFNFIAVLPTGGKRLIDLQPKILDHLNDIMTILTSEEIVRLTMPKFKLHKKLENVKKLLNRLLIKQKRGQTKVPVDDILHEAYVEVTEDGVEAVAATGGIQRRNLMDTQPEINLNKPFVFMITASSNAKLPMLLFYGNLMNLTNA